MKIFPTAVVAAGIVLTAGCSRNSHEPAVEPSPNLPVVAVEVATARVEELPSIIEIPGTVRPAQRAVVAAKVMGTIDEFPVVLGQTIRKGDVLATISAGEIKARATQARSQLNQAERDLAREKALLEKKASTGEMVHNLEDRVAMTQAMVREAEIMTGYTTIVAPFDGVVSRKMAGEGDLAAPGTPLLEIETQSSHEIECGIPDSLAGQLQTGAELVVRIPDAHSSFSGAITEISPSAKSDARSVAVRISIPATVAVRSGQFVRVLVPGAASPTLLVPASSVTTLGQMERIFVVQNDRALLRLVKTGARRGDQVEILAGLFDGDTVVTNPPGTLREFQPLRIQP